MDLERRDNPLATGALLSYPVEGAKTSATLGTEDLYEVCVHSKEDDLLSVTHRTQS